MTTTTTPLGLTLFNSTTDNTNTFLAYRLLVNGPTSSGFTIINDAIVADRARLTTLEALKFIIPVTATYSSGSLYVATVAAITSYVDGTIISLSLDTTSPGTTTLNISSAGVRTLVKINASGTGINLTAGDLVKNHINFFKYDIASTTWFWIGATSADQINIAGTTGNVVTVNSGSLLGTTTSNGFISATVHDNTLSPNKVTPADLDEFPIVNVTGNVLNKVTWANIKATILSSATSLGSLIIAGSSQTPVAADIFGYAYNVDSTTKKATLATIVGVLKTLIATDTLAAPTNITTNNVTSTAHGFAPVSLADATKFLNSAATPAYALVKDSDLSLTDITTNNSSTSAHGFLKKLPSTIPVDVMRGDGTWGGIYAPDGFLQNGAITVTVASNNITVAIKTLSGGNPSATDPVYIRISGVIRSLTAALSVTKNAGTNWFSSGSTALATSEIDYFCYLGYNATDGVTIGFSRIPYATSYGDFSATTTNEKYCAISTITTAASTDEYINIGRFAATLSATASFNWSVPTFTAVNLINRPIFETRLMTWTPAVTYSGGTTDPGVNTINFALYRYFGRSIHVHVQSTLSSTVGNRTQTIYSLPFTSPSLLPVSEADNVTGSVTVSAAYVNSTSLTIVKTISSTGTFYANGVINYA